MVRFQLGAQSEQKAPFGAFFLFVRTTAMFCEHAKPRGAGCENSECRRGIICSHKVCYNVFMNKKLIIIIIFILITLVLLGFARIWSQTNIFGTQRINTFEFFGKCWMGDVRVCDYDPLDEQQPLSMLPSQTNTPVSEQPLAEQTPIQPPTINSGVSTVYKDVKYFFDNIGSFNENLSRSGISESVFIRGKLIEVELQGQCFQAPCLPVKHFALQDINNESYNIRIYQVNPLAQKLEIGRIYILKGILKKDVDFGKKIVYIHNFEPEEVIKATQ